VLSHRPSPLPWSPHRGDPSPRRSARPADGLQTAGTFPQTACAEADAASTRTPRRSGLEDAHRRVGLDLADARRHGVRVGAPRPDEHARPGAGQRHAQRPERFGRLTQPGERRHEARPRRLVEPVVEGQRQVLQTPSVQRVDSSATRWRLWTARGPRHVVVEHRPGPMRRESAGARHEDERQPLRRGDPPRHGRPADRQREAAVDGRRHVVGMPLDPGRVAQEGGMVERLAPEHRGGRQAGHDRGAARAAACAERKVVVDGDAQPGASVRRPLEQRPHQQVRAVGAEDAPAVTAQLDPERAAPGLDDHAQPERERDGQTVEAGPEVGRRAGRGDGEGPRLHRGRVRPRPARQVRRRPYTPRVRRRRVRGT
jgi:hypothetical protein